MSRTTTEAPALRRVLGLPALVAYGLSSMGVLTVFTVYGTASETSDGHLPAVYLVALVAMLFTAHSYGRLAKVVPSAGSSYAYTSRVFGPVVGFFTGWLMMLDYLFLPMVNFIVLGVYLNSALPSVPVWAFTLACLVLVLAFNIIGVKWVEKLNYVSVGLSFVVGAAFIVLAFTNARVLDPAVVFRAFVPGEGGIGPIMAGAGVLALAFLGFDGISTLAEETRNPRKTLPRAVVLAVAGVGGFSILIAAAGTLLRPDWRLIENLDAAGTEMMYEVGGSLLMAGFLTCYVVGSILGGTAAQMSVSRVLFAMGRDRILPGAFARIHPRFRTPYVAALIVSAFSLIGLFLTLDQAIYMVNFGALVAFAMVNLSVIKFFGFDRRRRGVGAFVSHILIPALGFIVIAWLWTSLHPLTFVLGGAWLVVGVIVYGSRTKWFRAKPPVLQLDDIELEEETRR